MKHSLGLTLVLSATMFFVSACSNTPYEDTADSGSTGPIPEAGPLTGGGGGYGGGYTQAQPGSSSGGAYYPPQTAQTAQPQQPANNGGYGTGGGYDSYAGGNGGAYDQAGQQQGGGYDTASTTNGGGYDYSGGNNDSYNSYGTNTAGNGGGANPAGSGGDYYAGGNTGNTGGGSAGYGGGDYYAGGGSNLGNSSGRAAVQVFASGSSSKAEQVRSSMASRGLTAVVDSVDGLYKVRVPFGNESEARANLMRVRSASGESGAFVTFR